MANPPASENPSQEGANSRIRLEFGEVAGVGFIHDEWWVNPIIYGYIYMETSLTNSTKTRMSEARWGSLLSVMLDGANQQT